MKKTLAQQLRTNIKMRMAELDVTGEQVYAMAGYKSRVGYNTRILLNLQMAKRMKIFAFVTLTNVKKKK